MTGDDKVGVTVTFSLPVNASGATLSALSAVTDGSGKAVVTYTAGANNPTLTAYDTVRAAVGSISSAAVITRTGTGPVSPLSIAVAASPASVTAGQVSIVTATLTGTGNIGVTVSFAFLTNPSGATLSASSAVTDGSGHAVVIYQPGATNLNTTIQDTVQAAVGTSTSAVAITRIGSSTLDYRITVTATALTLANMNSVVTATVANNLGTAVSNVTVTFTIDPSSVLLGNVLPLTSITDGNGIAQTVYTGVAGGISKGTAVVDASITIGGKTYTAAVIIIYP